MTMLAQTEDGDIRVANNRFSIVQDKAEIRQRIINELRSFLNEWFLDRTLGVAWFQIVFQKGQSPAVIETEIKNAILGTEGVTALDRFEPLDYDPATRGMSVDFTARTVDDETIEVQETIAP